MIPAKPDFMNSAIKTIPITEEIRKAVFTSIKAAIKYEKLTGRKLGITGEVGEVLVCDRLKLKLLSDPISAGHDAIDEQGKRYQIKARRVNRAKGIKGRIGTFSKHEFDSAVLIILDENYEILKLFIGDHEKLKPVLDRHKRRNPSVREFINIAKVCESW